MEKNVKYKNEQKVCNKFREKCFDSLYCLDVNGKIKNWNIKVMNNGDYSEIITLHGYVRQIETRIKVSKGKNIGKKNETTHFDQAILEASSKWKKKKETENYSECKNAEFTKNEKLEDTTVTHFPMLAQDYKKHKNKLLFPCFIQPKLDGYRMIYNSVKDTMTSRTNKQFNVLKFHDLLYKELNSIKQDVILDGELYVHDSTYKFENYGVLRKSKKLTENDKINLYKIEYHVYDIIDLESTFIERNKKIKSFFEKNNFDKIKYVPSTIVKYQTEMENAHLNHIIDGYEGTMVRNTLGKYKTKYRSYDLLKYKNFNDSEYKIVNFTFEKDTSENDENLIIWTCQTQNGCSTFNVRPKGTAIERKELYKNGKNYIGKYLWVKYFGITDFDIPRFPSTARDTCVDYIRDTVN